MLSAGTRAKLALSHAREGLILPLLFGKLAFFNNWGFLTDVSSVLVSQVNVIQDAFMYVLNKRIESCHPSWYLTRAGLPIC